MTSKERTRRAIKFECPDRIPLLYFNKYVERGDIIQLGYGAPHGYQPSAPNASEWGFKWKRLDNTMGQPYDPPIRCWDDLDHYIPPDPYADGRFDHIPATIEKYHDKFLLANLGISGFNFVTFLCGVEEGYVALYEEPERLGELSRKMRVLHSGRPPNARYARQRS